MIGCPVTSPVFVGRQEEQAVLDDARRALAKCQGSMVLVGGEPGIGKTRLLTEFIRSAAEGRSRNLAVAECRERAQQPFGLIRTFLSAFERAIGGSGIYRLACDSRRPNSPRRARCRTPVAPRRLSRRLSCSRPSLLSSSSWRRKHDDRSY